MKVYLAGQISGTHIKECVDWRIKIRQYYSLKDWPITFLDPLNGKEFAEITEDGLKSDVPAEAIFDRDKMSVEAADVVVVNLENYDKSREPFGSHCELAWAGLLGKPIILITKEMKYSEHPFVKRMVSWIVPDVDTMLKLKVLNYMFKGLNNADY
jgi:nucleoside 2-deoxyribosyltransferase